jgi:MFS family permease
LPAEAQYAKKESSSSEWWGLADESMIDAVENVEPALAQVEAASSAAAPSAIPGFARALRHRNYQYFWSGNLLSNVGTWMQNVAQGWLVLELAKKDPEFWLGMVGFAASIPTLVFSLIGGVIADRVNRRRLLIWTQTSMMVVAFALAALTWMKVVTVPQIVLLAFATGLATAMNMPSYQAMVSDMVPPEDLTNAIALNAAQYNMSRVVGPMLGGFAMAWVGMAGNFFLNGLSFLAVIFALTQIRYPRVVRANADGMWQNLGAGFRYVFEQRVLIMLVTLVAVVSFFGMTYLVFVPLFARNILGLGERGFGLLMAAAGVGALLGATVMATLVRPKRRGKMVVSAAVCFFVAIILFSFSRSVAFSAAMLGVVGFSMVMCVANVNALLQELSSAEMRGRVMSMHTTAFLGFVPVGSLVAGSLAGSIGAPKTLAGMAAIALVAVFWLYFSRPELRKLN